MAMKRHNSVSIHGHVENEEETEGTASRSFHIKAMDHVVLGVPNQEARQHAEP